MNNETTPAYFRRRAMYYRMLADKAEDPKLAQLCRDVAAAFDGEANRGESSWDLATRLAEIRAARERKLD
jgi:hypothetical protein